MKKLAKRELLIEKFDKPDIITSKGTRVWKNKYGQIHRDKDKPAIIWSHGERAWYKNGEHYYPNKISDEEIAN